MNIATEAMLHTHRNARTRDYGWLRAPMVLFVAVFFLEGLTQSRYNRMIDQQEQNASSSSTSIYPVLSIKFSKEPLNVKESAKANSQEQSIISKQQEEQSYSSVAVEPLWQRLGFQSCRMPEFYDPSRQKYDLTLSSTVTNNSVINDHAWIIDAGWRRREVLKAQALASASTEPFEDHTNEYYQMMIRKEQIHYHNSNNTIAWKDLVISRNISFVHVGKAGGSSLGCHLAEARRYVHKHCTPEVMKRPTPLSALSLHVNCYTHWQGHMYCYDNDHDNVDHDSGSDAARTAVTDGAEKTLEHDVENSDIRNNKGHHHFQNSFLVNIRNPIDRMASWFLYEHILNHEVNYAERGYHCGDLMLFSCFETWDDLVTQGLGPIESSRKNTKLKIGGNLTQEQCSQWAWAAVQGAIPASYHNYYNYDWYAHHMMIEDDLVKDGDVNGSEYTDNINKRRSDDKELFVIRAEHLQDDWIVINQMLSGSTTWNNFDNNSSSFDVPPVSLQERQNAAQRKDLIVYNKTSSRDGITNLCRALCREIQIYKALIRRAVNLQAKDWEISLRELQAVCPNETSLQPRSCPPQ